MIFFVNIVISETEQSINQINSESEFEIIRSQSKVSTDPIILTPKSSKECKLEYKNFNHPSKIIKEASTLSEFEKQLMINLEEICNFDYGKRK